MDLAGIQSQWKDKGGFEGFMANPMFTLGLRINEVICYRTTYITIIIK